MMFRMEMLPVHIRDARSSQNVDYTTSGFHLASLESDINDTGDQKQIEKFMQEVEAVIRELHPQTKLIEWDNIEKNGGVGNHNFNLDGPRLEFYQDPILHENFTGSKVLTKPDLILGVWKPVEMKNEVIDNAFVYMDASTFHEKDQVRLEATLYDTEEGVVIKTKKLGALPRYSPGQKWFFHSKVKSNEVILLTKYSKGRFFANPNCMIEHQDLPRGKDTTVSLSTNIAVYFQEN